MEKVTYFLKRENWHSNLTLTKCSEAKFFGVLNKKERYILDDLEETSQELNEKIQKWKRKVKEVLTKESKINKLDSQPLSQVRFVDKTFSI